MLIVAIATAVLVICIYNGRSEYHSVCQLNSTKPVATNSVTYIPSNDKKAFVATSGYMFDMDASLLRNYYQALELQRVIHTDHLNKTQELKLLFDCATLELVLSEDTSTGQFDLAKAWLDSPLTAGRVQLSTDLKIKFGRNQLYVCRPDYLFFTKRHDSNKVLILHHLLITISDNPEDISERMPDKEVVHC